MLIGYTYFSKDQGRLIRYGDDSAQEGYGVGEVETVISLIDKRYLETIDRKKMVDSAIHSAFENLDAYSRYVAPENREGDDVSLSTDFVGIGIEMFKFNDSIYITHSNYQSETRKAGVNEGDVILSVNGETMVGPDINYDILRAAITAADTCTLEFLDYQTKKVNTVRLENSVIENSDATIHGMLNDEVGIIKIRQFNSRTYEQFMKSLENLDSLSDNLNLIIDVRDNPGGFLPQVTRILDQLIFDKDRLILSTRDRSGNEREYFSKAKNFFKIDKLAVLVNENSASASEILAGVVQDLDIGVIVGDTTFGKGLVQEQFGLASGGKLRLTVSSYHLPSGRSIQKWQEVGISYPDCDSLTSDHFKSIRYNRPMAQCSGVVPDIVFGSSDCTFNYLDMTMASLTLRNKGGIQNDEEVIQALSANYIKPTQDCLLEYKSQLGYMINRRSMPDDKASFVKLKQEPIVMKTIDLLGQPLRDVLVQE